MVKLLVVLHIDQARDPLKRSLLHKLICSLVLDRKDNSTTFSRVWTGLEKFGVVGWRTDRIWDVAPAEQIDLSVPPENLLEYAHGLDRATLHHFFATVIIAGDDESVGLLHHLIDFDQFGSAILLVSFSFLWSSAIQRGRQEIIKVLRAIYHSFYPRHGLDSLVNDGHSKSPTALQPAPSTSLDLIWSDKKWIGFLLRDPRLQYLGSLAGPASFEQRALRAAARMTPPSIDDVSERREAFALLIVITIEKLGYDFVLGQKRDLILTAILNENVIFLQCFLMITGGLSIHDWAGRSAIRSLARKDQSEVLQVLFDFTGIGASEEAWNEFETMRKSILRERGTGGNARQDKAAT